MRSEYILMWPNILSKTFLFLDEGEVSSTLFSEYKSFVWEMNRLKKRNRSQKYSVTLHCKNKKYEKIKIMGGGPLRAASKKVSWRKRDSNPRPKTSALNWRLRPLGHLAMHDMDASDGFIVNAFNSPPTNEGVSKNHIKNAAECMVANQPRCKLKSRKECNAALPAAGRRRQALG